MSEKYVYEGFANLFRGIESVGGKLYLTEDALLHRPHDMNIQIGETIINLNDISEVTKRNTMVLVPNGMLVKTVSGSEYKFVVYKRNAWIEKINQLKK